MLTNDICSFLSSPDQHEPMPPRSAVLCEVHFGILDIFGVFSHEVFEILPLHLVWQLEFGAETSAGNLIGRTTVDTYVSYQNHILVGLSTTSLHYSLTHGH